MPRTDAATDLAVKLIEELRNVRDQGGPYPLAVMELAARVAPAPWPAEVERALSKKQLAPAVVRARKKDPTSPIALAEDRELLAASDLLLEHALRRLCTADKPLHPVPRVVKQVDAALQPALATALERRLAERRLPGSVGAQEVKGKTHLYLNAIPPPPPKKAPAVELAERLVQAMEQWRARSDGELPPTLAELMEQLGPHDKPAAIKQAPGKEPFRSLAVFVAAKRSLSSPVVLADDVDRTASSPAVLAAMVAAARTPKNQAVSFSEVKKKLGKALHDAFLQGLERRIQEGALPAEVGLVRIKGRTLLFLTEDLAENRQPAPTVARPAPLPVTAIPFEQRFDEAFRRLDRGGDNLVSLVDLRREVREERATFDAELNHLRRAGRYSLSGAEGRHGIGPEEKAAGIIEGGNLLLYVSRKQG
jgi:hypothetical protein